MAYLGHPLSLNLYVCAPLFVGWTGLNQLFVEFLLIVFRVTLLNFNQIQ